MKLEKIYNALIENNYFTEKELQLVCDVAGFNEKTINDSICSRYGYNSFEQLMKGVFYE